MSVSAWCRENGINTKTYYYHLRKLPEKLCGQIPVAVTAVPGSSVHIPSDGCPETVMTVSTDGIRVEIYASAPAEGIEAVIRVLKC